MAQQEPLKLMGAPGSPYTRKMLALLRFRRIPHAMIWGSHRNPPAGTPEPKVKLLPTFYFPNPQGGVDAVVDSTPIVRRLEGEYAGRSAVPSDPVARFLNYLIEDYADEWLTKAMFHFRWAHRADADNAGPMLIFWSDPTLPDDVAVAASEAISRRQIDRLYVVGSNDTTAKTIEESYGRFLDIVDRLIQSRGYVLGTRPSSADFAIFGQLTQLAIVEPTSAAITITKSRRIRAWLDRMEDLSGLEPEPADWDDHEQLAHRLAPLLAEIGRVYSPFLIANAAAQSAGEATFATEIDGRAWTQPTFPYQARCLTWIAGEFAALNATDKAIVKSMLVPAGCGNLLPS